jgi:hypothetical protein
MQSEWQKNMECGGWETRLTVWMMSRREFGRRYFVGLLIRWRMDRGLELNGRQLNRFQAIRIGVEFTACENIIYLWAMVAEVMEQRVSISHLTFFLTGRV